MHFTKIEREILALIIKSDGTLRKSKPKITDRVSSYAAYVWRMLAHYLGINAKALCLPVMAHYDLLCGSTKERVKVAQLLDTLVDKIMSTIPVNEWRGVMAWHGLI